MQILLTKQEREREREEYKRQQFIFSQHNHFYAVKKDIQKINFTNLRIFLHRKRILDFLAIFTLTYTFLFIAPSDKPDQKKRNHGSIQLVSTFAFNTTIFLLINLHSITRIQNHMITDATLFVWFLFHDSVPKQSFNAYPGSWYQTNSFYSLDHCE